MDTHCIGVRTKWYGYMCVTCTCYEQIFPKLVTFCGCVFMNWSQPWSCSCWFSNTKKKTQSKNSAFHTQGETWALVKGVIYKLRHMLKESVTLLKWFFKTWQHWLAMSEWKLTYSIATQKQCSQLKQGRVGWGSGISLFLLPQCRSLPVWLIEHLCFPLTRWWESLLPIISLTVCSDNYTYKTHLWLHMLTVTTIGLIIALQRIQLFKNYFPQSKLYTSIYIFSFLKPGLTLYPSFVLNARVFWYLSLPNSGITGTDSMVSINPIRASRLKSLFFLAFKLFLNFLVMS